MVLVPLLIAYDDADKDDSDRIDAEVEADC